MPRDLIVEIGTEEIPAAPLKGAIEWLEERVPAMLARLRLECAAVTVLGTPRRLAVHVSALAEDQPELREEIVGPPARVAFDEAGAPTKAAEGFARKNGVELADLARREVEGKGGEYVVCTRLEVGLPAISVLPAELTSLFSELPWPKSMRWSGGLGLAFVRPIQWLAAVYGDEVVPFELGGVASKATSRGHRFLSPEPFKIPSSRAAYESALRERQVIVDPAVRKSMIVAELARLERESGAIVRPDPALVDEVANLVEYPIGLVGEFDRSFLTIPEAVIVSAMRNHQRYFAMEDASGALVNRFAAIAGTITRDVSVVVRGNQRVLAARLADAIFFWGEDQKVSLEELAQKLDGVVFQKKLGSLGAKIGRVGRLAAKLAERVGEDPASAVRAAKLCKADLVSSVVGEFPELQGTIGRAYATAAGEPADVAAAIEEHYMPRGSGDALPSTATGSIVGIADRMDTVVGCFAAGLAPTGSADPYGLRRAVLAVLSILLERSWSVSIAELIGDAKAELEGVLAVPTELCEQIAEFFRVRLKGLFSELPADCVEAALAAGYTDVPDARARASAVAELRGRADFGELATAFKRVANILKGENTTDEPDPERFVSDAERALWIDFSELRARAEDHLSGGDYGSALSVLAMLRPPVDVFFDAVLVMDEDDGIRQNRLALLGQINATFTRIADFRQLAV